MKRRPVIYFEAQVMRSADDAPLRANIPDEVRRFLLPSLAFIGVRGWGADGTIIAIRR